MPDEPWTGARIAEHAAALRTEPPEAILAWALHAFAGRVVLSLSFGGAGVALAHMLHDLDRTVPVVFLDTGMLFEETVAFRRAFADRYGLDVVDVRPAHDPGPLYESDPERCCAIRKVEPMARAIRDADAWVSALRRDQSDSRRDTDVLELHRMPDGHDVVKVHPLAYWDRATVWRYIHDHDIPYHPLLDDGYSSLGCWPCTRRTHAGEPERAGRWSGTGKTECGLHTFTALQRAT